MKNLDNLDIVTLYDIARNAPEPLRGAALQAASERLGQLTAAREEALRAYNAARKTWAREEFAGSVSAAADQAWDETEAAYRPADKAYDDGLAAADAFLGDRAPLIRLHDVELEELS